MGIQKHGNYGGYRKCYSFLNKKVLIKTLFLILIFSPGCLRGKTMPREDYLGSDFCARCHVEEYYSWLGSAHFNASSSLEFQNMFLEQGSSEYCFSCHTSGYKENDKSIFMKMFNANLVTSLLVK